MFHQIEKNILKIRQTKPLILNLTNYVTMNFIADGLLALGASPIMSNSEEELEDLLKISQILVINIGTLDDKFIKLCRKACEIANKLNKSIVLDPVGVGASHLRTNSCQKLLQDFKIAIIRGNASEVMALSGLSFSTKGVDSTEASENAIASAKLLSRKQNATILVSGPTDVVVDGEIVKKFHLGSPLMPQITGTGCLLTSVVGAFYAVEPNRVEAACAAAVFYGACGEMAAKTAKYPGSFKVKFLDTLTCDINVFKEISANNRKQNIIKK
jgi:hydroxyethylthiazole kinase